MAVLQTRNLGNTGIAVTRLSAGGHFTFGPSSHEDIPRRVRELNHMIDHGLRYFDVQWEPEEAAMAEVMKTRRDEIAVAWPLHGVTKNAATYKAQDMVNYCNDHRKRFGIDHVDVLLWIALELAPETQDRLMDEVREGFRRLKTDGFCDHLGFSCHHSADMALHAITTFDDFSVMMVPFSPLHPAAGRGLLAEAHRRGVGTVGMKPFGGGGGFFNKVWAGEVGLSQVEAFARAGNPYQAALRWVLACGDLDCTVPGMHSVEQIDELLAAAGGSLGRNDEAILETFRTALAESEAEVQLGADWD